MKFSFRERGSCFPEIRRGKVWLPIESAKKKCEDKTRSIVFSLFASQQGSSF